MINVPQEIKDILHQDTCPKNIRIHFPNGERADICNDQIVMDSVSFKESLCSQNSFKFGLAESPIFECEVVGVSNIKGATIEVYCEVYCPQTIQGAVWRIDIQKYVYPIKYGEFVVHSCERQTDILHRKIISYGFTQNLNNGLSSFEIAKLRFTHNSTYTPCGFLFSLGNFGLKKYDPEVFVPETLSPTGTEEGITRTLSWRNITTQEMMRGEFNIEYDVYSLSSSSADYLHYILIQQAESVDTFTDFVYDFLYQFDGYRLNKELIRNCIINNERRYTVTWSTGGKYYGGYEDEMVCYPYMTGATVTIRIPRYLVAKVPLSVSSQTRTIKHEATTVLVQKLTQQYYEVLNYFRLNIPIGLWGPTFDGEFSNQRVFQDCMELIGCFGNYRDGFIKIVNIRLQYDLLSDDDVYPGTDLFPGADTGASILPQDYQSCWYDEDYTKPFGRVLIYYTDTSDSSRVAEYYIGEYDEDSDMDSYQTYTVSRDNMLLKSTKYIEAYIYQLCYEIAENLGGVTFMPVKLVGRGLPYVQPGDTFEILTATNDSITTIVLSRTLKGEMVLTDEYVSVT